MLTGMTDADWTQGVEIFRACRSRRGDKGRDDRKVLEAMPSFSVHNITWRALPATFGKCRPPSASGTASGGTASGSASGA